MNSRRQRARRTASTVADVIEAALCRSVGCSSPFSRVSVLPHRYVCTPFVGLLEKAGLGGVRTPHDKE